MSLLPILDRARWRSLRRPKVPGRPWPGRGHALLCSAIIELELEDP